MNSFKMEKLLHQFYDIHSSWISDWALGMLKVALSCRKGRLTKLVLISYFVLKQLDAVENFALLPFYVLIMAELRP